MPETAIIYNVTIKIAAEVEDDWLQWLKSIHVPEVLATGCFTEARILHLLETDESEGGTYAVQYFAENKAQYSRYMATYASGLRQKSFDAWGNNFVAFRTLMEVVN